MDSHHDQMKESQQNKTAHAVQISRFIIILSKLLIYGCCALKKLPKDFHIDALASKEAFTQ